MTTKLIENIRDGGHTDSPIIESNNFIGFIRKSQLFTRYPVSESDPELLCFIVKKEYFTGMSATCIVLIKVAGFWIIYMITVYILKKVKEYIVGKTHYKNELPKKK